MEVAHLRRGPVRHPQARQRPRARRHLGRLRVVRLDAALTRRSGGYRRGRPDHRRDLRGGGAGLRGAAQGREDAGSAKSLRDGWYFTGDTGYFDAEGDLFVSGRVDDMIISGGENISPVDIESVLSLHPAVDEVKAVAGVPDPALGPEGGGFRQAARRKL
ncbi:hypothetical protein ACU4GD_18350 [Cupriavidus basilensis]